MTLPSPTNRTLSTRQLHHVKTTSARSVDFSLPDRPSARRRESPTKKTTQRSRLDVGGVEHDADGSAEGLGGEVVAELGAHNTGVAWEVLVWGSSCVRVADPAAARSFGFWAFPERTVGAGDLAPDHANVGAADLTLSAVDESDLLAKVEVGGLGVINTLNLDQAVFQISDSVHIESFTLCAQGVDTWCWE